MFAFRDRPARPAADPQAFRQARSHLAVVLGSGAVVGLCLGLSTGVFIRWGLWWFALSLSIVIAVMMVAYVAVPSRLIGVKPTHSKRDKLAAAAVGGAIGAVVCTPPYLLGRIGLLMLGLPRAVHPGHHRVPDRPDLAGGHHECGQGGQDGRQAHLRIQAGPEDQFPSRDEPPPASA